MRIAQVAPLYESVPPPLYGGTERVVSYLTEELVRMGHEVTLYASGDAETSAKLVPACPRALWRDERVRETVPHHVRQLEQVWEDAARYDVVHFHGDFMHFPMARRLGRPSVTTLHGRLFEADVGALFEEFSDLPLVSISDDQRRPVPWANWKGTVHHGLPEALHSAGSGDGGYLVFLGRMSPEKGIDRAIRIARAVGLPLKVAAHIYPDERGWYEREIAPLLAEGNGVEFVGEVGGAEKEALLGGAMAMLFPIAWPEPFGLVMIEAMACGTPVIAWRNGSVPEVVTDGETGFVVETEAEAQAAIGRVRGLSRRRCREAFEERFGARRMAEDYVALYQRLLRERARPVPYAPHVGNGLGP